MTPSTCRICGQPCVPDGYSYVIDPICCATRILVAFYRGRDLTDTELAWAINDTWATIEQRELAIWLAANFHPGEETFSGAYEHPQATQWLTRNAHARRVHVVFSGGYTSPADGPIEDLSFPDGLPPAVARSILGIVAQLKLPDVAS